MRSLIISEQEKQEILSKHALTKMILEAKMETVSDLEKEIQKLEKKLEELKKKRKKKETTEGEFEDLLDADSDLEADRDSLEQS